MKPAPTKLLWLYHIVWRYRRIWKYLTGENPVPRLYLALMMATAMASFGVCGIVFSLLGALLMLGNPPEDTLTWSKVGDVFAKSFWSIVIGYGAASVIHAVVKLYEKQNHSNTQPCDECDTDAED